MKRVQAQFMVVRYVPSILREEFVNVGLILACPEINFQKLEALPSLADNAQAKLEGEQFVQGSIARMRHSLQQQELTKMLGEKLAPEGRLTFEGMMALHQAYCNNIQFSKPRTVLTDDPEATLEKLFEEYVGQHLEAPELVRLNP